MEKKSFGGAVYEFGKNVLGAVDPFVRGFANGTTLGQADRLEAFSEWATYGIGSLLGKGAYKPFSHYMNQQRTITTNNEKEHPVQTIAGEVMGIVAPVAIVIVPAASALVKAGEPIGQAILDASLKVGNSARAKDLASYADKLLIGNIVANNGSIANSAGVIQRDFVEKFGPPSSSPKM